MDWKMFFSTFALIFLAELGDKTQLTALARSAAGGRWIVFFAASLALVCSTLVAVLFGSVIKKYIPEMYIKLVAGALFLIFGTITLISAFRGEETPPATVEGVPSPWVYRLAAGFEEAAWKDYLALAARTSGEIQQLFLDLAEEEREHLTQLQKGYPEIGDPLDCKGHKELFHDAAEGDRPLLVHAAEHEKATADFYGELARQTTIPAIRKLFTRLASEERSHQERLEALV